MHGAVHVARGGSTYAWHQARTKFHAWIVVEFLAVTTSAVALVGGKINLYFPDSGTEPRPRYIENAHA